MLPEWRQARARALAFLRTAQKPDGSFNTWSSPTKTPFTSALTYRTTFVPSLILQALSHLEDTQARDIRTGLAQWLLGQRSSRGSFNYWAKDSLQHAALPYPDDLDDTACAWLALYRHDPALVPQAAVADIVKLLLAAETQVGGPYRTWLVKADAPVAWQDIDLAVNANINCLVSYLARPLPSLTRMMEQAIHTKRYESPYYPSAFPLYYYLARAYRGPQADALAHDILAQQQHGWWQTPLQTALAISALSSLGRAEDCQPACEALLAAQQADGSWPAEAFCVDPSVDGQPHYNGCAALTTALAVEALGLAGTILQPTQPRHVASQATRLHDRIMATAQAELTRLDTPLRSRTQQTVARVGHNDTTHEITLLPFWLAQSLAPTHVRASNTQLANLGLANLYGWTAYAIYDDFLDESGQPALLPVANYCMRQSLRQFALAVPDPAFTQLTRETFDNIDTSNSWELTSCRLAVTPTSITLERLPRYGDRMRLAERSLGHTLGPMGVLAAHGIALDSDAVRQLLASLKHYLIARQLADDLHDWEQDVRAGHASYVVCRLLQHLNVTAGTHALTTLLPNMQRALWHELLLDICQVITYHTNLARHLADRSALLVTPHCITELTAKQDAIVSQTLREQQQAQQFLAAYSKT